MMDFNSIFADWPYLAWALSAAGVFYGVTAFAVSHMHPDKKAHLSLWLQGDYESTWSTQFCAMFDSIFGENHLHLRCMVLSSLASVAAVFALWLLFDHILGLISLRADTNLSLGQALLLGAAINIIPDYISLYETRWLLKIFERIRNPLGQLLVLILDAVITGFIIYFGVMAYLWVTGKEPVSLIEMVALFSLYAIFFYSTFLTSIWAWAYCLSSWVSRLARWGNWLNVSEAPGKSLALIGAIIVLIGSLTAKPLLTVQQDGRAATDDMLCFWFPVSSCTHIARMTKDEKQKLVYLSKACLGGVTEECLAVGQQLYNVRSDEAINVWRKSCAAADALSCVNLGFMHGHGMGTDLNFVLAAQYYLLGCEGGAFLGCSNLGHLYENGLGVDIDRSRAFDLYLEGCKGGEMIACFRLEQPSKALAEASRATTRSAGTALLATECSREKLARCRDLYFQCSEYIWDHQSIFPPSRHAYIPIITEEQIRSCIRALQLEWNE